MFSRLWQFGHSLSEYATTRATGTVFPQCGHSRVAIIQPPENFVVTNRGIKKPTLPNCLEAVLIDIQRFDFGFERGCRHAELSCGAEWP
jgi:hypothetical protein